MNDASKPVGPGTFRLTIIAASVRAWFLAADRRRARRAAKRRGR